MRLGYDPTTSFARIPVWTFVDPASSDSIDLQLNVVGRAPLNMANCAALVSQCVSGDGCCPFPCRPPQNGGTDADCYLVPSTCGNGRLDPGETCDFSDAAHVCPTSCSDGDPCTTDTIVGSAASCNVACATHSAVTTCT